MTRCLPTVALAALAVSVTLSTGHPAVAGEEADKSDVFAARLFAGTIDKQKKTYGCFVRRYDAAHLARHPLQKVGTMKLLVTAEMLPEAELLNFSFRVGVRFRHRPGDFDSSGDCAHGRVSESADAKEQLGCAVDCDGGGIVVELAADNKSTLVRLELHPHLAQQQAGRRGLSAQRRRRRSRVPAAPGRPGGLPFAGDRPPGARRPAAQVIPCPRGPRMARVRRRGRR